MVSRNCCASQSHRPDLVNSHSPALTDHVIILIHVRRNPTVLIWSIPTSEGLLASADVTADVAIPPS